MLAPLQAPRQAMMQAQYWAQAPWALRQVQQAACRLLLHQVLPAVKHTSSR